jgi:drug/metabolite transporter (DMT)-like permease
MSTALIFALLAAVGNAIFVFGQRGSTQSENPFLFTLFAVGIYTVIFFCAAFLYKTPDDISYVISNFKNILISGVGFFVTFVGFFLLYNRYGASYYNVYAVLSIMTTSIVVGTILYREPFNIYHFGSTCTAVVTVFLFWCGQMKA